MSGDEWGQEMGRECWTGENCSRLYIHIFICRCGHIIMYVCGGFFSFGELSYDLISKFAFSLRLRLRWAAGMRGCEVESLRV